MRTDIEPWQAAASLVLVAVVVALSVWRKLGIERSVLWAAARAAVQLIAVGLLFTLIFESRLADVWAAAWIAMMVLIAGYVVARRTGDVRRFAPLGLAALGATLAVVLGVVFGLGVLQLDPVAAVVIAGITIGNTMPAVVQAVDRTRRQLIEQSGEIEAMLALGFDGGRATNRVVREVSRLALIPQIERTKVVGLIALPGAMTGLLLAGVDPLDAVLIQLVVMFLVLGAVAVAVILVTTVMTRQAMTEDLRLANWATEAAS